MLFLANVDPPPAVTLCHTSRDPQKYVTHLGPPPPIFSRPNTKNPDKSPLYKLSLNCSRGLLSGAFVRGLPSRRFCPGWFCPFLLLSEYIYYNRKLKITLDFMFHIYDKKIISVTSHALDPSPVTNCHTFSDPSHPLERDVLYGRPL